MVAGVAVKMNLAMRSTVVMWNIGGRWTVDRRRELKIFLGCDLLFRIQIPRKNSGILWELASQNHLHYVGIAIRATPRVAFRLTGTT